MLLVVDGFNVLHAGVLRGRDRAGWRGAAARRRLVERVEGLAVAVYQHIWIVFDGPPGGRAVESRDARIRIVTAPSADDWIVEQVQELASGRPVTVVTSDRGLRQRVQEAGGATRSPRWLLAACPVRGAPPRDVG